MQTTFCQPKKYIWTKFSVKNKFQIQTCYTEKPLILNIFWVKCFRCIFSDHLFPELDTTWSFVALGRSVIGRKKEKAIKKLFWWFFTPSIVWFRPKGYLLIFAPSTKWPFSYKSRNFYKWWLVSRDIWSH